MTDSLDVPGPSHEMLFGRMAEPVRGTAMNPSPGRWTCCSPIVSPSRWAKAVAGSPLGAQVLLGDGTLASFRFSRFAGRGGKFIRINDLKSFRLSLSRRCRSDWLGRNFFLAKSALQDIMGG